MTLLTWNHECAVGVGAMDDQHGILMDAMNDLRLAAMRGASPETIRNLLNQLVEFTRMHFLSEEQLMEQYGFPGLAGHRAEHQRLLAHLMEYSQSAQRGEAVPMRTLLSYLRDWFVDHIGSYDQQYGPWLNGRGVL